MGRPQQTYLAFHSAILARVAVRAATNFSRSFRCSDFSISSISFSRLLSSASSNSLSHTAQSVCTVSPKLRPRAPIIPSSLPHRAQR